MAGGGNGKVYFAGRIGAYFANRGIVILSEYMGTDWAPWGSEPAAQMFFDPYNYGDLSLRGVRLVTLHVPYDDNSFDDIVYVGYAIDSAYSLLRHNHAGTWDNIGPSIGGTYYYPKELPDALHSFVGDRLALTLMAQAAPSGADMIFTSADGGDTWLDRNTPASSASDLAGLWGWPYTQDVMMCTVGTGADRGLWLTRNLFSAGQYAVTWLNLLGDWETVTGDTFINPINVVPVWVP